MIFYTADLHFGHKNVIKYAQRPFKTVNEMDRMLIESWNKTVSKKDKVYILGDFMYKSKKSAEFYLKELNGKKYLIIGNHDKGLLKENKALKYFEAVELMSIVTDGDNKVVLCHYPIAEWPGYFKGWYHAYGHIHNIKNEAFDFLKNKDRAVNAGVDINNYKPVTLKELINNNRKFKKEVN